MTYRGMKYQQRGRKVSTVVYVKDTADRWKAERVSADTPVELKRAVDAKRSQSGKLARATGTVADMMAAYLDSGKKRDGTPIAPTTARKNRDLARHITSIGAVKVKDLKPKHVRIMRDTLLAEGRLADQTVSDVQRLLSQACLRAVADGDLLDNPAAANKVARPGGDVRPFVVIDAKLAETILATVKGTDPWDPAAHLALGLTLRREEVLGLTWDRVDLDAGTVTIDRTVTFADGQLHHGATKTKAGTRTLSLPPQVLASLKRHKAAQDRRRLALGSAWLDLNVVVDRGDGSHWSPPSFSKGWARFAARHGFEGITFHTLRHGAATLMLASGVADAVAIRVMGHASTNILKRYQEVVPDLMADAAARMGAVLGGG